MNIRERLISWLTPRPLPAIAPALPAFVTVPAALKVDSMALVDDASKGPNSERVTPWQLPKPPPFVPEAARMALDDGEACGTGTIFNWAGDGLFSEGLGFLGYAYLAELSQRPEYRRVSTIWAEEATRKFAKLTGDDDKCAELQKVMDGFDVRGKFREAIEQDGFFGRSQIFIDMGHPPTADELSKPLLIRKEKIGKGKVKNLKVIEPFWSYPGPYDSTNPLAPNFYRPKHWQVMGSRVHTSRLLTFVGREMPDMLKPAYSFGGLSLSQMIKPYVDNFLRTRQSVSDLIHSFSTMVLSTNMGTVLQGAGATDLMRRAQLFNQTRDNRGLMLTDKDTEELTNVTTPLSGLDSLQSQSQEQIASAAGIPLVILLGVTPSGLNASSDGEIRSFYATIKGYQERVCQGPYQTIMEIMQLHAWGAIDPDIGFEFIDLWEMSEKEKSEIRKSDADADVAYVSGGIVSADEVRDRIVEDPESPWYGRDLAADAPEAPDDADMLQDLEGDDEDGDNDPESERSPRPGDKRPAQDAKVTAAGVWFSTPDGRALFVRRAPGSSDHVGKWSFPGGTIEKGESAADAARREAFEEVGYRAANDMGEPFDIRDGFALFRVDIPGEFAVKLNREHDEATWAYVEDRPTPTHPTTAATIDAFTGS